MLPHSIAFSATITSPTGRGVVLIGGHMEYPSESYADCCCQQLLNESYDISKCLDGLPSKKLIELSGNSEPTLKWSTMKQTLDCGGIDTIAIPISNEIYHNLEALRKESILCFNNPPPVPDYELEEYGNPFIQARNAILLFILVLLFANIAIGTLLVGVLYALESTLR